MTLDELGGDATKVVDYLYDVNNRLVGNERPGRRMEPPKCLGMDACLPPRHAHMVDTHSCRPSCCPSHIVWESDHPHPSPPARGLHAAVIVSSRFSAPGAVQVPAASDPDGTIDYWHDNLGRTTKTIQTVAGLTPNVELRYA